MARVTVEDCITKIPNRFELVLSAAQRAKEIGVGAALTVERDNDKNSVVALREIAEETIPVEEMKENVIRSFQKATFMDDDENEEDIIDLMEGENDWSGLANFGSDDEMEEGGMHTTDADTEKAAAKQSQQDNEHMIGSAIDPSTVPEDMLRYDE